MQESLNEKISLFIDDELTSDQALSLLKGLKVNAPEQERLQRYLLISQVIKNEPCFMLHKNFADSIHQQIRNEPIIFRPAKKSLLKRIDWGKAGLALAASLALAAVLLSTKLEKQNYSFGQPQLALNNQHPTLQANVMNPRLNEYLQAHDNSVYISNVIPVQPYARVAGFHQE